MVGRAVLKQAKSGNGLGPVGADNASLKGNGDFGVAPSPDEFETAVINGLSEGTRGACTFWLAKRCGLTTEQMRRKLRRMERRGLVAGDPYPSGRVHFWRLSAPRSRVVP